MSSIMTVIVFLNKYKFFYILSVIALSLITTYLSDRAKTDKPDIKFLFRLVKTFMKFASILFLLYVALALFIVLIIPKTTIYPLINVAPSASTPATSIPADSYSMYGGNWYLEKVIRNRKEFYEDMTLTLNQDGTVKSDMSGTIQQGTWKMLNGTIEVRVEQYIIHLVGNGDMLISTGEPRMEFNRDPSLRDLEQTLRLKVSNVSEDKGILAFGYADYDRNGSYEAFALMGRQFSDLSELDYNENATLWFVCEDYTLQCETKGGCYPDECELLFQDGGYVFRINEGYGGSGSQTRLWSVESGKPTLIAGGYALAQDITNSFDPTSLYADDVEGMTQGEGDNWYAFPSYFDMFTDGSGHTWKRYYYHWNGWSMREYGGIEVPVEDIRRLSGGREALEQVEARGFYAWQAFYRGNDIINVNLTNEDRNYYLTFRWKGGKLILLDVELNIADSVDAAIEDSPGYYFSAHTPQIADYPSGVPWKL